MPHFPPGPVRGGDVVHVALLSSKLWWMQKTGLQSTRHDIEVRFDWLMLRPPDNFWHEHGVGLLARKWCSPAEGLHTVCSQIEIFGEFRLTLRARASPRDIVGLDMMFLDRLWYFS